MDSATASHWFVMRCSPVSAALRGGADCETEPNPPFWLHHNQNLQNRLQYDLKVVIMHLESSGKHLKRAQSKRADGSEVIPFWLLKTFGRCKFKGLLVPPSFLEDQEAILYFCSVYLYTNLFANLWGVLQTGCLVSFSKLFVNVINSRIGKALFSVIMLG